MAVNGCDEKKNPGIIQITILHPGECKDKIKQRRVDAQQMATGGKVCRRQ
jgi:hypothetical protein